MSNLCASKDIFIETKKGSKVGIKLIGVYDQMPVLGYYPMVLEIKNGRDERLDYQLRLTLKTGYEPYAITTQTDFEYSVNRGEMRRFELLLPVPSDGYSGQCELRGTIEGPFITSGQSLRQGFYQAYNNGKSKTYVCLSPAVFVDYWARISVDETGKEDPQIYGSNLELARLPIHWRGYWGIDSLWFTEHEWTGLNTLQKKAIIEWVSIGGLLCFVDEGKAAHWIAQLGFEEDVEAAQSARHGLGNVYYFNKENQTPTDVADRIKRHALAVKTMPEQLEAHGAESWPIQGMLLAREFDLLFIMLFLIFFGVVVGPVNLFIWAKGNKRYRLFFTTPLLSIAASIFLLIYILIKDGIGGEGVRNRLVYFMPEQRAAVMLQEQYSQTGVLFDRTFKVESLPFIINGNPYSDYRSHKNVYGDYIQKGDEYRGDWFSNRDEQSYYMGTIVNTRSRLELVKNNPPEILSSIDARLTDVFYIDDSGVIWKSSNVALGQKVTFSQADSNELDRWLRGLMADSSPLLNAHIKAVTKRKNSFIASVNNFNDHSLETLPSIDWKHDRAIFIGKVYKNQPDS